MLALDVLLLMMIAVCIVYCWILNQRIRDLHNSRVEFARMIKEFDAAVVKAENCISELSTLGANATMQVKNVSIEAEHLIAELKTVNDFGQTLGAKLERSISDARKSLQHLEDAVATKASKSKRKKVDPKESKQSRFNSDELYDDEEEVVGSKFKGRSDELLPEHKNLLETVLSKITTHKQKGTVDQNGFYDSLRKVSVRK